MIDGKSSAAKVCAKLELMDRWTPKEGYALDAAKDEVAKLSLVDCTSGDCSRKRTKLSYTEGERPVVGDGSAKGTIGSVMKGRRVGESGVQKCCIRTKGKDDCDCFTDAEGDCSACYANADCATGVKLALGRGNQDCAKKFDLRGTCGNSAKVVKAKIITDAGATDGVGVVADLSSAIEKIKDQVTAVRNLKPYDANDFVARVKEAKKEIVDGLKDESGNAMSLVGALSLKCGDEGVDCQRCCKRTSDGCACISEASGACRPKCSDYLGAARANDLETLSDRRDRRSTTTSTKLLPAGPVKVFLTELNSELIKVQTEIPKITEALEDPDVQSLCKDCLGASGVKPIREVLAKVKAVEAEAKAEMDGQKKGYSEYVESVQAAPVSEYSEAQKKVIGVVDKEATEELFKSAQGRITDIGLLEKDFSTEASTALPPEESTSAASSTTSAFGVVSFAIIVAVATL